MAQPAKEIKVLRSCLRAPHGN